MNECSWRVAVNRQYRYSVYCIAPPMRFLPVCDLLIYSYICLICGWVINNIKPRLFLYLSLRYVLVYLTQKQKFTCYYQDSFKLLVIKMFCVFFISVYVYVWKKCHCHYAKWRHQQSHDHKKTEKKDIVFFYFLFN